MDDPAKPGDFEVCNFFVRIRDGSSPSEYRRQNQTTRYMRYTKLPLCDFESKVKWPMKTSYVLQPRLRRIVTINDEENVMRMAQSLRSELGVSSVERNIHTDTEFNKNLQNNSNKEKSPPPKQLARSRFPSTGKYSRPPSPNPWSSVPSRYSKHKTDAVTTVKQESISSVKSLEKATLRVKTKSLDVGGAKQRRERDHNIEKYKKVPVNNNLNSVNKMIVQTITNKKNDRPSFNKDITTIKKKTDKITHLNTEISVNKQSAKPRKRSPGVIYVPQEPRKTSTTLPILVEKKDSFTELDIVLSDMTSEIDQESKNKHVPAEIVNQQNGSPRQTDDKLHAINIEIHPKPETKYVPDKMNIQHINTFIQTVELSNSQASKFSDIKIGTDPEPAKIDVPTEMNIQHTNSCIQTDDLTNSHICKIQIDDLRDSNFENLEIPNITLLKDKSHELKDLAELGNSHSLPNLHLPPLNITSHYEINKSKVENSHRNASYIIGRATLTYTTKQKIDFHVVSNNDKTISSSSPNPLAYPMNVVTIFKKEMKNKDLHYDDLPPKYDAQKKKYRSKESEKSTKEIEPINRSLVPSNSKLVKPSELISSINGLLHSNEICEQFQRELNFIDSFFESLQYLESCSLTNNCINEKKVENWVTKSGFDVSNPEYDVLLSKFENGTNIDDIETMASKSLCLLNLLIRDEQRRAKNLLFVLKMREDALKDFTKSQILWLENKKKQDNIDITTLKKKQRGALLKLQHECGEMQRMRKALLSLSEKRKLALIKTKKNIEIKMKNNMTADQMLLNKKKIKRCSSLDRPLVPLKCFDLSSSGCDESGVSRPKSECAPAVELAPGGRGSAEKSSQAGDSAPPPLLLDQATDTDAENYVTVDGSYLNILFHNLKLPEIFSRGKSYEVNEEALKSIVNSANSNSVAKESDILDKFVDLIKNREPERSSSPSTARSLVEEFDQYYKDLNEEVSKSPVEQSLHLPGGSSVIVEVTGSDINQLDVVRDDSLEPNLCSKTDVTTASSDQPDVTETRVWEVARVTELRCSEAQTGGVAGGTVGTQAGLPSAAPAPALHNAAAPDTNVIFLAKAKPPLTIIESVNVLEEDYIAQVTPASSSPVHNEAEELRRQQLAIEREIKALEQQQCQLLVVREIPDKPPPPYTPPTDVRASKLPRRFQPDGELDDKIQYYILEEHSSNELEDAYDQFISDFCYESVQKYKEDRSDKPWDSCNLLPQKPPLSGHQLVEKTSAEIREVLSTNLEPACGVVPAMSSRRSDHIDDILFAEWRRCEPEWTALHADEVALKGQIFEGIFQHVLSHTIDAYKTTVLGVSNDISKK